MTISKKLALAQTILLGFQLIFSVPLYIIYYLYNLEKFIRNFLSTNAGIATLFLALAILLLFLAIITASFVLGIIQIVKASKNNEDKIFLVAGILALPPITAIPAFICNIIGLSRKNIQNDKEHILSEKDNASL